MKKSLRIIILLILGMFLLTGCQNKTKIVVTEPQEYEINSDIDFTKIIEINNGVVISNNPNIDTSILGSQEITFNYLNEKNKQKTYSFVIKIVDTEAPIIECLEELTTTVGNPIDLLKDVIVTDNSLEDIRATVLGNYDFNKVGNYELKFVAIDSSGNKAEVDFILKVKEPPGALSLDKNVLDIIADGNGTVFLNVSNIDVYKLKWNFTNKNIVKNPSLGFNGNKPYFRFQSFNLGTTEATISTPDGKYKATILITVKIPGDFAMEVLNLTNIEREKMGLLPLILGNSNLIESATLRAKEAADYWSHTRPNGSECFTVLSAYSVSYRLAGENLAQGQRTPTQAVSGWMDSKGHKDNILAPGFTHLGVGVFFKDGVFTYSQMFIGI